jgi:hypothetical protein
MVAELTSPFIFRHRVNGAQNVDCMITKEQIRKRL